ncbi:5-oxoprolinase subunit PxpB [Alloyangia pacifica]|uniref:Sensor histidine kinase inhibitor, KipI family n=1 Tax=Alloyangia pacifica TaxID=311180 RepID=A0A1I6VI30_9RHOB|nr:5-oxoprolinase subunit PxpB [Alloyangia pacifica]SDH98918.1 sensor histidine kinase inhibitor, KipI family [Alloyangia pacifica]SFT13300.1 sensor histidine kinase inhibitor, KipI family [Alloyangia pacifica]
MTTPAAHVSEMGESALLIQSGGPMSLDVQRLYWALDRSCRDLPGVTETVLGVHSLLLRFDPRAEVAETAARLPELWSETRPAEGEGRLVEIPVHYGGAGGEDLAELAACHDLGIDEVVALHSAPTYTVFALGSQPGFPYLGGLDPRLATPRRSSPRQRVEEGSVVIGGEQAGVIARTSPSGWHIIGATRVSLFDHARDEPALLQPGDQLRFSVEEVSA